ncbi:hypothetical protein [Embleya sp. NPDC001921]
MRSTAGVPYPARRAALVDLVADRPLGPPRALCPLFGEGARPAAG